MWRESKILWKLNMLHEWNIDSAAKQFNVVNLFVDFFLEVNKKKFLSLIF